MDNFLRINDVPMNSPKKPPAPKPTSTPVDASDRKFYVQAADRGNEEALEQFDAALAAQSEASSASPPATTTGSPNDAYQDYLDGQRERITSDAPREHVRPMVADDPSDQKFYNMAADRENTIIDLENKAHSLNNDIEALGTSGGYATQAMQAELTQVERELDGYRLQDLRVEAAELRREIANLPSDSVSGFARQGLQARLDLVDQQITDTSIRTLEGEAAEINEKLSNLPSDSFSGYARQELEARLKDIEQELDKLRTSPIPYEELGVDRQQFDALVDAAMRDGGLNEDDAIAAISSSLRERKAAENQALQDYVGTLLKVSDPLAEQIVAFNQGEIDQIDGLPPEVQDALSRVEIRMINGTDQPFLVGQPVDVEAIGDYFGDTYGAELSADQLNDGTWATVRPFDAHYEPPTMGQIHTFLDVAGMVPVIGEFADGANALIYLAEGDYVNAGISAAALLPVGGQAFTGTRLGAKVLDRSRDLMNGLDATLEATTTVDGVTINVLKMQDGSYAKVLELEDGTTAVITGSADELGLDVAKASDNAPAGQVDGATTSPTTIPGGVPASRQDLIDDVVSRGEKITPADVVDIRQLPDGRTVWLESGNPNAGLEHILRHSDEFAAKGIPEHQIPDALFTALEEGRIVGYQGKGNGRPIYEFTFNGETQRVAVTVGENGFIVGANPKSVPGG
jgi:hypothetical protein